jgi:hypothetical protein
MPVQNVSAGIFSLEADGVGVKNSQVGREEDATVFLLRTIYCGRYDDCQIKHFLLQLMIGDLNILAEMSFGYHRKQTLSRGWLDSRTVYCWIRQWL